MDADPAIRAAQARARMGVRRHPVVRAVILSGLAVQAVEIAAEINRGHCQDLDRALIRTLADGLGHDLEHARRYALARNLQLGPAVALGRVPALMAGQAREHDPAASLTRSFVAAADLARGLCVVIDEILTYSFDLRIALTRDHDLEPVRELADGVGSCLTRARALCLDLDDRAAREQVMRTGRAIGRAVDQALEHARAMDRICGQALADRLGIAVAQGLAAAVADGALDDFTSADLTSAGLADADLTGVRWSLTGTTWPQGTDIKALLARSQTQPDGVLEFSRRGMMWQPNW